MPLSDHSDRGAGGPFNTAQGMGDRRQCALDILSMAIAGHGCVVDGRNCTAVLVVIVTSKMAVRLFLTSGARRDLEADGAHMDRPFFLVTRWDADLKRRQTVVTLRSNDVVSAEILKDGVSVEVVLGAGVNPKE